MGRNLAGILQIVGAGVAGYMKGKQQQEDREAEKAAREADRIAREEDRAWRNEQRERERREQREADGYKEAQKLNAAPVTPEVKTTEGATYKDAGGAKAEDLMNSDDRELRRGREAAAVATGQDPAALEPQPITPAAYIIKGTNYNTREEAEKAAVPLSSAYERNTRHAQTAREAGKYADAEHFDKLARDALNEGTDKTLAYIQSGRPTLDAVEKAGGKLKGGLAPEAIETFNKTGGRWKLGEDTAVEHFIDTDSTGQKFVNSRVVAKDGRIILDDVNNASRALLSVRERMEVEKGDRDTRLKAEQLAEVKRSNEAGEKESSRHNRSQEGIAYGRLGLERRQYEDGTPAGKIRQIEQVTGKKLTEDQRMGMVGLSKIPEADRLRAQSLMKQQEKLDEVRNKAMAEGTWQPDSPGAREITEQSAALSMQINGIMAKYSQAGQGAADPLGIMGGEAPAGQGKVVQRGTIVPRQLPTQEQLAERDRRDQVVEAFKAKANAAAGGTRRADIIAERQKDAAVNFDTYLGQIRRGMPREEAQRVLSWMDMQADSGVLSNMQLKQLREARRAAGF